MGEFSEALRRARIDDEMEEQLARRLEQASLPQPEAPAWPLADSLTELPEELEDEPEPVACEPTLVVEADPDVVISDVPEGRYAARIMMVDDRCAAAACYRQLASRVERDLAERGARSVLVAGTRRGDGATTTACNLALALAEGDTARRVALVDLDLSRPGVADALDVSADAGIEAVLCGDAALEAARLRTDLPGLDLFLPGGSSARSEAILAAPGALGALARLAESYDRVVIDAAPLLRSPHAAPLLAAVDACISVAKLGATRRAPLRALLAGIPPAKRLGVVAGEGSGAHGPGTALRNAGALLRRRPGAAAVFGLGLLASLALGVGTGSAALFWLGGLLAAGAGSALALLQEARDPVLAASERVGHELGVPLLATVPRTDRETL